MPALLKALGDKGAGTTVLQVQCGGAHTLALCDNGDVYAWGSNDDMQLGLGPGVGKKVNRPELVTDLSGKGILRIAVRWIPPPQPPLATSPTPFPTHPEAGCTAPRASHTLPV